MIIILILSNYFGGWFLAYGLIDIYKKGSSNNYEFKNFTLQEKLDIRIACITGLLGIICLFSFYFIRFIIKQLILLFKEVFY